MKKLFLSAIALLTLGLIGTSCSKDATISANQARDYETDVLTLAKFVDINKSAGEYYLNENKKNTPMSYITDKDIRELELVAPAHRIRFEKELNALNNQLAIAAQREDVGQIVYTTYSETWVRNLKENPLLTITEDHTQRTKAARANYATMSLWANGFSERTIFDAGKEIYSNMLLTMSQYQYYFFEVKCATDDVKKQNLSGGTVSGGDDTVILSGMGQGENFLFKWTVNTKNDNVTWDFTGQIHTPNNDPTMNVRIDFTD